MKMCAFVKQVEAFEFEMNTTIKLEFDILHKWWDLIV